MKKDIFVILIIVITSALVYRQSFFNFFAQDDFILIYEFSQNNISADLKNTFGFAKVTHWRPIHNLYFLISGNVFNKNYFAYHVFIFLFHAGVSFLIYKISKTFFKTTSTSLAVSLIYAAHPAHFVSLFWISGAATTIGFFFLLFSLYLYLKKKLPSSLFFYSVSLLAQIGSQLNDYFIFKDQKIYY